MLKRVLPPTLIASFVPKKKSNPKGMRKKFANHYFMSICMTDQPMGEVLNDWDALTELPAISKKSVSITANQAEFQSSVKISEILRTEYGIHQLDLESTDLVEYRIIEFVDEKRQKERRSSGETASINQVVDLEEEERATDEPDPAKWVSVREVMRFDAPTVVSFQTRSRPLDVSTKQLWLLCR